MHRQNGLFSKTKAKPIEASLALWLDYNFRSGIIKSLINYYSFISFLISTDHPVLHQIHNLKLMPNCLTIHRLQYIS